MGRYAVSILYFNSRDIRIQSTKRCSSNFPFGFGLDELGNKQTKHDYDDSADHTCTGS